MEKKNIPLTSLLVNTENPRYEIVHNQIEAIRKMIEDQDEKLYNLAEDIVKNGLNPTDLIIVVPYEKESKKYIVLEGNNVPSSNLERLLSDPDVREIMGISIEQVKIVK